MNQKNMELYKKKLKLLMKKLNIQYIKTTHLVKRNIHSLKATYQKQDPKTLKKYHISAAVIVVSILSMLFVTNLWMNKSLAAFSVEVDDQVIGTVRAEDEFWKAVDFVREEVASTYQQELVFSENVKFKPVKADDMELTGEEGIIRNIRGLLDFQVKSVAIMVDGKEILLVKDMETAESVLESLKQTYTNEENAQYEEISFSESVELVEMVTEAGVVKSKEEAVQYITKGTDEEQIHEVADGDNSWTIAKKYNLSLDDIAKANPEINLERLKIGQKISLVVPTPFISILTKEYVELVETIPYETTYEDTSALYEGDRKIIAQGSEGQRELKAYIIKENGVVVNREVVEEKVIAQPTDKIVAKGTKPRPKTMATGAFSSPTRGRLTSGFGMRWGSRHEGIDVAAPTGTPINAADGGKVSFAGKNGAYGNLVIVDHENGYQTYYAHNNSILVKKGDRVHKGQKIATVGSTGRSTGPHLHFEVRKGGKPINPLNFVKY